MYISSGQKKAALVGTLLIAGAAAFVYLDPLELDLLGLNPPPVVTPPPPPRPPVPKVVKPVAPVQPIQPVKPIDAKPAPAATTVVVVKQPVPAVTKAAEPAVSEPPVVKSKPAPVKPFSPPSVDLRHCLEKATNEEIARCAQ